MIKVDLTKDKLITISGHSGYEERGKDIVCASVSSIVITTINAIIEIDRENAISLEKGEYFIADLLDSEVFTEEGEKLGILDDIYNTGSKDIYVVKNELGKTILLPGINDVIKEVDVENKKIIVHLLKGLV